MSWIEAAARWYGTLIACTWAFAPAVRWLCAPLADRGATVTRPIAMLAAIYPAWLLSSTGLVAYGPGPVLATLLTVGVGAWLWLVRRERFERSWLRGLLLAEAASLALFLAYLWLRGFTPDIMGTEKPMDVAFLASSARATTMPPPDPWFAGESINYYYLGYLLYGTFSTLAGVLPEIGFNLALATVFSTTLVAAGGLGWNAVRPWFGRRLAIACGALASFGVALAGNLYAPGRLLQEPLQTVNAWWWDSAAGIGWRSSRIVCDGPRVGNLCLPPATETINEFPFFSFLLGDLHPHLMALPYTLVAIGLAWSLALKGGNLRTATAGSISRVACAGVLAGALYALNAWDMPTFMILLIAGVWMGAGRTLAAAWRSIAVLLAAAVAAWSPFFARYVPPTAIAAGDAAAPLAGSPLISTVLATLVPVAGERTSVTEYFTIFGIGYGFGVALVILGVAEGTMEERRDDLKFAGVAAVATVVPAIPLAAPLLPLCGIPLALAIAQLRRLRQPSPQMFALALLAVAWALSIGVEVVFIRDAFFSRMNTLFKFYFQVWTLYAVAAAVAMGVLWAAAASFRVRRIALAAAVVTAIVAGLSYPLLASLQWTGRFADWRGLDGLAYGDETAPDDVAAIRWLAEHAVPGDVVLEAAGCAYLPFDGLPYNRVAAFSGVPTVIGWGDNHQRQWRAGQPALLAEIRQRQDDVATMYRDPSSPLFADYDVRWLFVGQYETQASTAACKSAGPYVGPGAGYPGPGWREAFRSGATRVYERVAAEN